MGGCLQLGLRDKLLIWRHRHVLDLQREQRELEGGREGGRARPSCSPPPYTLDRTLLSRGHRCAGLMQCPQSSPPAPRRLYLGLRRKLVPLLVLDVSDLPILHLGKEDRPVKARGGGGEGPQAGQFREGFARNGTLDWTASPGGIQGGSA